MNNTQRSIIAVTPSVVAGIFLVFLIVSIVPIVPETRITEQEFAMIPDDFVSGQTIDNFGWIREDSDTVDPKVVNVGDKDVIEAYMTSSTHITNITYLLGTDTSDFEFSISLYFDIWYGASPWYKNIQIQFLSGENIVYNLWMESLNMYFTLDDVDYNSGKWYRYQNVKFDVNFLRNSDGTKNVTVTQTNLDTEVSKLWLEKFNVDDGDLTINAIRFTQENLALRTLIKDMSLVALV